MIMNIVLIGIYIVLTSSGLVLFKYGTNQAFSVGLTGGQFHLNLSWISLVGLVCYVISFLLYLLIVSRFNLSYIMPLTMGIAYVLIFVLSAVVLKENITWIQLAGAAVVLVGLVLLNIKVKV